MRFPRVRSLLTAAIFLAGVSCAPSVRVGGAGPDPAIALRASLDEAIRAIEGPGVRVGLYARNLDTGNSIGIRENEAVRTASTIKIPIMVSCFRAVAEGRARWEEMLAVSPEAKVSGSGVIREFDDGRLLSLRDVMHVMIVVSDNTATNLILERLGADYVNETMAQLGLEQTRSMRKIRGDGTQLKAATGWSKEGEREENKKYGIGRSTPREMVELLENMENGELISPEASRAMIDVLTRQQYMDGIGRAYVDSPEIKVASKSGALDALRSDVGIVYHPKGRLAIAITVDGMAETDYSPDNKGNLLISRLTGILVEGLLEGGSSVKSR